MKFMKFKKPPMAPYYIVLENQVHIPQVATQGLPRSDHSLTSKLYTLTSQPKLKPHRPLTVKGNSPTPIPNKFLSLNIFIFNISIIPLCYNSLFKSLSFLQNCDLTGLGLCLVDWSFLYSCSISNSLQTRD